MRGLIRGQMTEDRGQPLARSLATAFPLRVRGRRGITLLEVLVSIGVIAVGLLGVATLIPLGSFAVNETAKADRSSAMGRAGIHDVRVRDMLEVRNDNGGSRWYFAKTGQSALDSSLGGAQWRYTHPYLIGQAFAVDPLFATEALVQSGNGNCNFFPFDNSGTLYQPRTARLNRLKLNIFEAGITQPLQRLPVLERIFSWQDDLKFELDEDDPDQRPKQICLCEDGSVSAVPDTSLNPLRPEINHDYTWMFTAEPDPSELPNKPNTAAQLTALRNHQQKNYTVSIVTFYKREFLCDSNAAVPSERFARISFSLGTGVGGGDAIIGIPTSGISQEQAEEILKVKENQWIMVTGYVADSRLAPVFALIPGSGAPKRRIARWYRVIRVDDEVRQSAFGSGSGSYYICNVTLAGPDWDIADTTLNGSSYATIIDGAIGVYTTTVTLP